MIYRRTMTGTHRASGARCELPTPDVILALCLAREIERDWGRGGHTTRATQDAAIAALTTPQEANANEDHRHD